ncbi:(4Fe-4S)-binding protein [Streptomyces albipurpureus]|uniref:(4Fe-4S)-binding protein n=1 Tax=Streptomyces albipurpureus TaxID=2897419 RepID=A0ABT0UF49_9ACTN|nr:(4Fe-4S)-binding protein [Streptomyces sp. CWNU-1]MCM2386836.1 (4Fe-4S)-binding protein [Streptomyces sp. CWNU-1]
MSQPKEYPGREITVTFASRRCLHAAECVRGLPQVFDLERRPWISPDDAPADLVAEIVRRCPSGALRYWYADGATETPDRPTSVASTPSGQLVLRGDLAIWSAGVEHHETRVTLCGCGASGNRPYCDQSGPCAEQ